MQEIITDTPEEMESTRPPVSELIETPTPNNPPWSGWVAVGVWVASLLLIVFVPMVFIFPYLASKGTEMLGSPDLKDFLLTDPTAVVLGLSPIILAHLLTLGLSWVVVTKMNRYSFKDTLGWKWGGFRFWHAIIILAGLYGLLMVTFSVFGDVETDFDKMLKSSRAAVLLVAFLATFTAPLVEEVIYRGILYSAFQRRFGIVVAVILVTVLFTVIHVPQYSQDSVPDYATISGLLVISLVLTLVRVKTDNLLPCVVLHTIFNGLQSLLLLFEPYLPKSVGPTENPASLLFM